MIMRYELPECGGPSFEAAARQEEAVKTFVQENGMATPSCRFIVDGRCAPEIDPYADVPLACVWNGGRACPWAR